MTQQDPTSRDYLLALADAYGIFGVSQLHTNTPLSAVYMQQAVDTWQSIEERFEEFELAPGSGNYSRHSGHYYLARTFDLRGMLVQAGPHFEFAERYARERSRRFPDSDDLRLGWVSTRANLAEWHALTGNMTQAESILARLRQSV